MMNFFSECLNHRKAVGATLVSLVIGLVGALFQARIEDMLNQMIDSLFASYWPYMNLLPWKLIAWFWAIPALVLAYVFVDAWMLTRKSNLLIQQPLRISYQLDNEGPSKEKYLHRWLHVVVTNDPRSPHPVKGIGVDFSRLSPISIALIDNKLGHPSQQGKTLNPGQTCKFSILKKQITGYDPQQPDQRGCFEIVALSEFTKPEDSVIGSLRLHCKNTILDGSLEYTMELVVHAENAKPVPASVKFWSNVQGILKVERIL